MTAKTASFLIRFTGEILRSGITLALGVCLAIAVFAVGLAAASAQGGLGGAKVAVESAAQDRYIVVFKDSVGDPRGLATALAWRHGFTLRHTYAVTLKGFSASLPAAALNALSRNPRVDYIEADQLAHASAQTVTTGIQRIFADTNPNTDIDGTDDWRVDVGVAVLDTGVATHPDLNLAGKTDCIGNPFNTSCDDNAGDDGHGHGTHVAGTIAALDNGIGVVGVAPGARIYAVKVLKDSGSGWISNIIGGVEWSTLNPDVAVANMSLGGGNSNALCDAVEASIGAGVTYAVAAGNDGVDAAGSSPANCLGVITVSALADFDGAPGGGAGSTCRNDQDDTLADFSNYGATVDIAAPGVCILSTWNDGGYNTISGTSMASPHVAGAAALLASNGNGPAAILATLTGNGNFNWIDESGDVAQEPLLDVGNMAVFAPATVAGPGGGGPVNTPPAVTISSPADGGTFASGESISFSGSAPDDGGDLTDSLAWTSNIDGGIGSGGSFSATLSDGSHTVTASVTDGDGAPGSDSVTITVGSEPPPLTGTISVGNIELYARGPHVNTTVTIVESGTGNPVPDVGVTSVLLTHDTNNSGTFDAVCDLDNAGGNDGIDDCWDFQPLTTDSKGQTKYKLLKAPGGSYRFEVLGLSGPVPWDPLQDVNNPATGSF